MKTIVLDLDDVVFDMRSHIKETVKHFLQVELQAEHFTDYDLATAPVKWAQVYDLMLKYDMWDEAGLLIDEHQVKYLHKLRDKGYRVVASTARDCWAKSGQDTQLELDQVYTRTVMQLLRHDLLFDEVIINPKQQKLKGINDAHIFVDDNFDNLLPYVDRNVTLLVMNAPWNAFIEHPKVKRIKRLTDIEGHL